MLVIGSAQAVQIVISIVRMKALALLLGPSGLGLLSIFNNLQGMVTQTAGLGLDSSGVREIASARGEEFALSRVRRVLLAANVVQGFLALLAVWLLRASISTWLFGNANRATEVGIVGGVALLALVASGHTALLQGLRRIGDLGRVTVIGGLASTVAGLGAVWAWGENGLIFFLLVQPMTTLLVAVYFTRQLSKPCAKRLTFLEIWQVWRSMAGLGVAFMLGGVATTATLLLVRGRISQELGLEAAGHFAAAWGVSMTYVGFMLKAMGADYYPRLAEVIEDRDTAISLINDQTQLALAIGGPVMLLLVGLAPLLIVLLYASDFSDAVTLLQWQTIGNVFKLASWPLGFAVVAQARSKTFMFLQINWSAIFILIIWPALSAFGIAAAGPAFTAACFVQILVVHTVVRCTLGFRWQAMSLSLLGLHTGLSVALLALAFTAPLLAALAAPFLAAATGIFGLRVVLIKIGPEGRIASHLTRFFTSIGWPLRSRA